MAMAATLPPPVMAPGNAPRPQDKSGNVPISKSSLQCIEDFVKLMAVGNTIVTVFLFVGIVRIRDGLFEDYTLCGDLESLIAVSVAIAFVISVLSMLGSFYLWNYTWRILPEEIEKEKEITTCQNRTSDVEKTPQHQRNEVKEPVRNQTIEEDTVSVYNETVDFLSRSY